MQSPVWSFLEGSAAAYWASGSMEEYFSVVMTRKSQEFPPALHRSSKSLKALPEAVEVVQEHELFPAARIHPKIQLHDADRQHFDLSTRLSKHFESKDYLHQLVSKWPEPQH